MTVTNDFPYWPAGCVCVVGTVGVGVAGGDPGDVEDSGLGGASLGFFTFFVFAEAILSADFSVFSFFTSGLSTSMGSGLAGLAFGASLGFSFFPDVVFVFSFLTGFSSSAFSLPFKKKEDKYCLISMAVLWVHQKLLFYSLHSPTGKRHSLK